MTNKTTSARSKYFTQERINGDIDYHKAQQLTKRMLNTGIISVDEFNKLSAINRKTFSPLFAEIMPKNLDV